MNDLNKRLRFTTRVLLLTGLFLSGVANGQLPEREVTSAQRDLEASTKQSISFLKDKVTNAVFEFRFETPDRAGGHDFGNGSKIPPAIAEGEVLVVKGQFKFSGQVKPDAKNKSQSIRMQISIQAVPVFNIFDVQTRKTIQEHQKFDWKYWKFDEPEDRVGDGNKGSSVKLKPHGEQPFIIDFVLTPKDGKFEHDESFNFQWQSSRWKSGTYYKIVAAPNEGLFKTSRSGVFSGAVDATPPAKKVNKLIYFTLDIFGYHPDPFYWLK